MLRCRWHGGHEGPYSIWDNVRTVRDGHESLIVRPSLLGTGIRWIRSLVFFLHLYMRRQSDMAKLRPSLATEKFWRTRGEGSDSDYNLLHLFFFLQLERILNFDRLLTPNMAQNRWRPEYCLLLFFLFFIIKYFFFFFLKIVIAVNFKGNIFPILCKKIH